MGIANEMEMVSVLMLFKEVGLQSAFEDGEKMLRA